MMRALIRWCVRAWFRCTGVWISIKSLRYRWWIECGNHCYWVRPYGFVPEADCPVHDPPPGGWLCELHR